MLSSLVLPFAFLILNFPMPDLKNALDEFAAGLYAGSPIFTLQNNWTSAVDGAVRALFGSRKAPGPSRIAIFGLGSYGRLEMSPYSDIDLMFLYDGQIEDVKGVVNDILYPLWDMNHEAGGATRTLADCKRMFRHDVRAQSAMFDARFVAGDEGLSKEFFGLLERQKGDRAWFNGFLREKYLEQMKRWQKFGRTVYMLEPHIKEGEGGLREFHTASFMDEDLMKANLRDKEMLQRIRAVLHLEVKKKEDRLTFDNQKIVAEKMELTPSDLMSTYYEATTNIHRNASALMDRHAPVVRRLLKKWRKSRIERIIGHEPSWQRMTANRDVLDSILFSMHRSKELKKLIPSFKDIYFKTQFGAYHVYTIDMHSILAVKKILELERKKSPKPLWEAYRRIKRKDVLLLATLLHDIGKGQDEGRHTASGADIAFKEAASLGYSRGEAEEIAFLVESHLIMPRIAFSRDLADPHLIENFAATIGSVEMLDMQFVLTYADIAAIGPDVWNNWKEKLLNMLYTSTRHLLAGTRHVHKEFERMQRKLLNELPGESTEKWIAVMPERYFYASSLADIKAHIEMFKEEREKRVAIRHVKKGVFSEFYVMTHDEPGMFSRIAGVMAAANINILEADLNTGKGGLVFDILRVQSELGTEVTPLAAEKVISDIENVFDGKRTIESLISASSGLIKKRGASVSPRVAIDNDVSVHYTVIDIFTNDRIGLLYELTNTLFSMGCTIDIAKILTKADLVQDTFYIKDFKGNKITVKETLERVRNAILGVL